MLSMEFSSYVMIVYQLKEKKSTKLTDCFLSLVDLKVNK